MGDWLRRLSELEAEKSKNTPLRPAAEIDEINFGNFGSTPERPFSPPLDTDGVPCGGCPSCGQGEFWRWPHFHPQHDPRGWQCWFCAPPPSGSGPCDFAGVPDQMLG
jgi:hypothetical protein